MGPEDLRMLRAAKRRPGNRPNRIAETQENRKKSRNAAARRSEQIILEKDRISLKARTKAKGKAVARAKERENHKRKTHLTDQAGF